MTPLSKLDWDLIRVFLALLRSTSLRQAANLLGVTHPTIRRRLSTLETELGLRLFDRRVDSLQATPEALALMEKAEAVEASIRAFERCAENADLSLKGNIRVSAPDLLMSELLAPDLVAFIKRWPKIVVDVETSYDLVDLDNREADIAFRIVPRDTMPQDELAGRKAATLYTAIYGQGQQWIGWEDREQQKTMIAKTPFANLPIHGVLNNVYLQRAACKEGLGLALLPCFMADPELERRTEPEAGADLWILIHPDLRNNPRLLLFRDEMFKALQGHQPVLAGVRK